MRKPILTGLFAFVVLLLSSGDKANAAYAVDLEGQTPIKVEKLLDVDLEPYTALAVLKDDLSTAEQIVDTSIKSEVEEIKHVVTDTENLSEIAKKYNTNWQRIFEKNLQLEDPDLIEVGMELIIPGPEENLTPRPIPAKHDLNIKIVELKNTDSAKPAKSKDDYVVNVSGNGYVAGYCTWYVKNKRPDLPNNLGNARTWVSRAASQGYSTGNIPAVGAVGQKGNHVVYVESINEDGTITISDMNYQARYEITTRVVNAADFSYIY